MPRHSQQELRGSGAPTGTPPGFGVFYIDEDNDGSMYIALYNSGGTLVWKEVQTGV
jgi:hypothetical protein